MPYFCDLEKRRPILAGNPLIACPSVVVRHEKVARKDYFLKSSAKKWKDHRIPSDFYLHQLLAKRDSLLKEDTRTLASWCRKWGAMEHPMRYWGILEIPSDAEHEGDAKVKVPKTAPGKLDDLHGPLSEGDRIAYDLISRLRSAGGEFRKAPTVVALLIASGCDVFPCYSFDHLMEVEEAIKRTDSVRKDTKDEYAVSMQECRLAIQDVSYAIEFMNEIILEGDEFLLDGSGKPKYAYTPINLLNRGIANEWQVACRGVASEGVQTINLTNAVCNQVLASVMEPEPWRVCPQCGIPYKHYQHDAKDFGDGKRRTSSVYCSAQCANASSNEAKKNPRNRIQH